MFTRLQEAGTASNTETDPTASAHASKHHLHQWLEDIGPPAAPPVTRNRHTWLPSIGLAIIISTTLLACGTSDTSEPTVSEQRTPASAQVATQSMPPTAGTTPDGPSNGQSASDTPTTQPREQTTREQPTKAAMAQEAKPTAEPTAAPTKAPMPTATPEPQHDLAAVLAPHSDYNEIIQRMDDNGEPIYPLSEIKSGGDPKYPQYPSSTESGKPKYPGLASRLQFKISEAIATAIGDEMFEQLPSDSRMPSAERLTLILADTLHKRTEWQVAEATADQITVNVSTHLIFPDPVDYPKEKVELNQRVTATVVLELVEPRISSYSEELVNHYDKAPLFSHLVGEPVVTPQ